MSVDFEVDGRVCTITLNRPDALNAFDREQVQAFSEACIRFRDDGELWVAIVTGAVGLPSCLWAELSNAAALDW